VYRDHGPGSEHPLSASFTSAGQSAQLVGSGGIEVAGRKAAATRHASASLPTGLPHGLPRCGEVWALREDCEAYTRSKVTGCALPAKFNIKVICYAYVSPSKGFTITSAGRSGSPVLRAPANPAARQRRSCRTWCKPLSGTVPVSRYRPATDRRRPSRCGGRARSRSRSAVAGSPRGALTKRLVMNLPAASVSPCAPNL
jgi:hypothetical protein